MRAVIQTKGRVNLAERSRRCCILLKRLEALALVGAEFALHTAFDKGPAHRRCFQLKQRQLLNICVGQAV